MEARPMEEVIAGEAKSLRRDERENIARRGAKDESKRREEMLVKARVEEDYWQRMVASTLPSTSKTITNESRCYVHD